MIILTQAVIGAYLKCCLCCSHLHCGELRNSSTPRFVVSKTRMASLKVQTIPRLKLLLALLLARLISNVVESFGSRYKLLHPKCFTDLQVALCWIRGVDKIGERLYAKSS